MCKKIKNTNKKYKIINDVEEIFGPPKVQKNKKLYSNKIDEINQEILEDSVAYWESLFPNANVHPISALTGFYIPELLKALLSKLPISPAYFPKDQLTDKPDRFFVNEALRGEILGRYSKEIPYSVEVITEEFNEEPKVIKIRSVI